MSRNTKGILLALIGGTGWGFSGACSQFVFAQGASPLWASAIAMLIAGVVLLGIVLCGSSRRREGLKALWTTPRSVARLFLFALAGLTFCRVTYLLAIQHSNAGTATVLQYIGPVIIVVATCFAGRRMPSVKEGAAVACVVLGTYLLATHGDPANMALSPEGIFWGLAAAAGVALYTIMPGSLMKTYGSLPVVASGMIIGGIALAVATQAWAHVPSLDALGWASLLGGLTFVGTIVGFTAYLTAVNYLGAAKASLIASVETVSATACAVLWLGTSFAPMDLFGFVLIMATVFLLAKKDALQGGSEAGGRAA